MMISLYTLLKTLLAVLAFGLVCVFILIEYFKSSRIGAWLDAKVNAPPKSLSRFNSRGRLTQNEFAIVEKDIPNIQSVTVISKTIDTPSRNLAAAIINNFSQGCRYSFFVSNTEAGSAHIADRREWFRHVHETAKGLPDSSVSTFDEQFQINVLPIDWEHVPYVFFAFLDEKGVPVGLALKGINPGVGISHEYRRVAATEANAIAAICAAASKAFEDERLPEVQYSLLPDANILPFERKR